MERRSTAHDDIFLSSLIAIYCHDVSKMFIWKSSTITCPGSAPRRRHLHVEHLSNSPRTCSLGPSPRNQWSAQRGEPIVSWRQLWNQKKGEMLYFQDDKRYILRRIYKSSASESNICKTRVLTTVQSREIVAGNHGKQDLRHVPNLFILFSPWSASS